MFVYHGLFYMLGMCATETVDPFQATWLLNHWLIGNIWRFKIGIISGPVSSLVGSYMWDSCPTSLG